MVEAVHPCLRVGLIACNGPNVVGFAVVVPCNKLGYPNPRAVFDKKFPSTAKMPVVGTEDPVFVPTIPTVVLDDT